MAVQRVLDLSQPGEDHAAKHAVKLEQDHRKLIEELERIAGIDGMPLGAPGDVAALSLAPFFTACPNPFIHREVEPAHPNHEPRSDVTAFAADIAAGKNDPLYFAHYYSTKVPPDAIVPYILHYTQPGDVVFDGFCGTGMTGVAAQLCGDTSRGYDANRGPRRAILSDLSPAAAFISAGTNAIGLFTEYLDEIEAVVQEVAGHYDEVLQTSHVGWPRGTRDHDSRVNDETRESRVRGRIEYVVWSDVFFCSSCGRRVVFWDLVFRGPGQAVPKRAPCPSCGSEESIATLQRSWRESLRHGIGGEHPAGGADTGSDQLLGRHTSLREDTGRDRPCHHHGIGT